MAWTTPRDWVDNLLVTAAIFNEQVRDNFKALKGDSGKIYLNNAVNLQGTDIATRFYEFTSTIAQRALRVKTAVNVVVEYGEMTIPTIGYNERHVSAPIPFTAGLFSSAPIVSVFVTDFNDADSSYATFARDITTTNFVAVICNTSGGDTNVKYGWIAIGPTAT